MSQQAAYFALACDLLRARHGTIPHPYFGGRPMTCPAFFDATHRFAFNYSSHGTEHWFCACGAGRVNAGDAPDLLTVNENTDFLALPFARGYNVEDYPLYLQTVHCERTVPPHLRTTILTPVGQTVCVACNGYQQVETHAGDGIAPPDMADCPVCVVPVDVLAGESSADWIRRMQHS